MKRLKILVLLLFFCLLASCNQGSSTTDNGGGSSGSWTIPGVGTEYIYTINVPDSAGNSIADTLEYAVTSTGQEVAGKSNAIRMALLQNGQVQPGQGGAYVIESNGDFSADDSIAPGDIIWKTYPTGSQKTISDPPVDSFSFGTQIITTDVRSFIGSENISTVAGNFSTLHVREVITTIEIDTTEGFSDTSVDTGNHWLAPSTGFFVKATQLDTENGQINGFNFETDLIKYLPKKQISTRSQK
jgi:hypothetical protein